MIYNVSLGLEGGGGPDPPPKSATADRYAHRSSLCIKHTERDRKGLRRVTQYTGFMAGVSGNVDIDAR